MDKYLQDKTRLSMRQTTAIIFCLLQVAGLASVLGLSVEKFKGSSPEMDELCKDLEKLLS